MSKFSVILVLMFSYPFILFMMRIQELRELSFQPYASRLSDFFFYASFCRFGRFRFGCIKKVGSG